MFLLNEGHLQILSISLTHNICITVPVIYINNHTSLYFETWNLNSIVVMIERSRLRHSIISYPICLLCFGSLSWFKQ